MFQNLTLDDLFKYCKYTDHQRTYVLKGVKHVDPNFSMPLMNHDLKYSCPLVSSLDEKMVKYTVYIQFYFQIVSYMNKYTSFINYDTDTNMLNTYKLGVEESRAP